MPGGGLAVPAPAAAGPVAPGPNDEVAAVVTAPASCSTRGLSTSSPSDFALPCRVEAPTGEFEPGATSRYSRVTTSPFLMLDCWPPVNCAMASLCSASADALAALWAIVEAAALARAPPPIPPIRPPTIGSMFASGASFLNMPPMPLPPCFCSTREYRTYVTCLSAASASTWRASRDCSGTRSKPEPRSRAIRLCRNGSPRSASELPWPNWACGTGIPIDTFAGCGCAMVEEGGGAAPAPSDTVSSTVDRNAKA